MALMVKAIVQKAMTVVSRHEVKYLKPLSFTR